MPAAAAFEDVLDERLREAPPRQTLGTAAGGSGTAAAYGFFFVDCCMRQPAMDVVAAGGGLRRVPAPAAARMRDGIPQAAASRSASASHASSGHMTPASLRPLSRREREALEVLVTLGARLDPAFTGDDLRTAFRTLALRYHPDRHPGCSDADRSRLAMLFGHAREAYRVLLPGRR